MTPILIYTAGRNRRYAEIALTHGYAYGAQLPAKVYHAPVFADQDWRAPNRQQYMTALAEHRPALATVLDWEREAQLDDVLSWAEEAAPYVSEAVIIIPKVHGGIARLPREIRGKQVRLGYSVPTSHGGTEVFVSEFLGWPVHALGGSPQAQIELAQYLNVVSVDNNALHERANKNQFFVPGTAKGTKNRWFPQLQEVGIRPETDTNYHAFRLSCMNWRNAWLGLRCAVRYAVESDLPAVRRIAQQASRELGYVMWPKLREAMARYELLVADAGGFVLGFCNWHRRRDGVSTVYEIAAHRDYQGRGVGRALLNAIPRPLRLKVTQDNERANDFYQQYGLKRVGDGMGRKRPLNVYELSSY